MNRDEYNSLDKAVSNWYELKKSRNTVLGLSRTYYFIGFIALFLYAAITETEEYSEFFLNLLYVLIAVVAAFITYVFYPSFVSRRERNGKSDYQFFTRRLGYSITIPFMFLCAVNFIDLRDRHRDNTPVELDDPGTIEDVDNYSSVNNGLKSKGSSKLNKTIEPVETPHSTANQEDSVFQLKEQSGKSASGSKVLDTLYIVNESAQPKDTLVHPDVPKKKKWRLFGKRQKKDAE